MNTSPIGVFDSGIGGLTVVKEILKQKNLSHPSKKVKHQFFVTDEIERVYNIARGFLGQIINGKILSKVTLNV